MKKLFATVLVSAMALSAITVASASESTFEAKSTRPSMEMTMERGTHEGTTPEFTGEKATKADQPTKELDLEAIAEKQGITVEELEAQMAEKQATVDAMGEKGERPEMGERAEQPEKEFDRELDLESIAEKQGITVAELEAQMAEKQATVATMGEKGERPEMGEKTEITPMSDMGAMGDKGIEGAMSQGKRK